MLTEKTMVLAKLETTYGADTTPAAATDMVGAYNVSVSPNTEWNDTETQDCSMSAREGTLGKQYLDITFDHELTGTGATPATPLIAPCDALLKACGYAYLAGAYTPYTTYPAGASSVTLWVHLDGQVWKASGARGDVEFTLEAGKPAKASFTFQSLFTPYAPLVFPVGPCGGDISKPFVCINQALSWGGTLPEVESLSFGLKNTLYARPTLDSTGGAYGIAGIDITARNAEGSFNPLSALNASIPFLTQFQAGTATALSYVIADAVTTITFTLPKCQIMNITPGDRSGTRIFDLPFRAARSGGNDEITLTYTATPE